MADDTIRGLISKVFTEIFNNNRLELVDEVYEPSFLISDPSNGLSNHEGGRDLIRDIVQMYRNAFSDLNYTVGEVVVEGQLAMCNWRFEGTHDGPLMGAPASGKKIVVEGCSRIKVSDAGKVADIWQLWDPRPMVELLSDAQIAAAPMKPAEFAMNTRPATGTDTEVLV